MTGTSAEDVVARLGLKPHPEGGFYRETFRDASRDGDRGASTAIYYLLREGDSSAWHRVTDAAEVWHHYAGAPLELSLSPGRGRTVVRLGSDLAAGEEPQAVVPAGVWQSARPLGGWVLVGCTVAPGFDFASFEMAPPGWEPEE
ncbi:MAG TPA: cupin domain-containing protein [Thermoanaerobaculia bacterium]|nr:cupin domain-containing protein [Thermoanaerobaculia bacterium]